MRDNERNMKQTAPNMTSKWLKWTTKEEQRDSIKNGGASPPRPSWKNTFFNKQNLQRRTQHSDALGGSPVFLPNTSTTNLNLPQFHTGYVGLPPIQHPVPTEQIASVRTFGSIPGASDRQRTARAGAETDGVGDQDEAGWLHLGGGELDQDGRRPAQAHQPQEISYVKSFQGGRSKFQKNNNKSVKMT